MSKTYSNITNQIFNRLTAISKSPRTDKYKHSYWNCKCTCGNMTVVRLSNLRSGMTKSCGCLLEENFIGKATTHGFSRKRFYFIFNGIKQRCDFPNAGSYKYYGGRGIKCNWKSFEDFKVDMHESYLKHCEKFGENETTIDRIDSNGNYCKENCRWSTWIEQNNNKRIK